MELLLFSILASFPIYLLKKAHNNTKDVAINKIKINEHCPNSHQPIVKILQLSDMHLENISITSEELYEKLKMRQ